MLWRRGPIARHIATQLIGCGTSIGSKAEEAQDAQTKPDYIAKMAISRKESRAMIVSAIRTAQSNSSRGS